MFEGPNAVRARLWAAAKADPERLAAAAHALWGRAPEADEWPELLDFVSVEWLDDEGYTLAERTESCGAAWARGVRTSVWVIDAVSPGQLRVRDLEDDAELDVRVPDVLCTEVERRTVLKARVVPWDGAFAFFGDPASYGVHGVLARMQLLADWRAGPEPSCHTALAARRAAFATQRDQHRLWVETFGADLVRFPDADALERALAAFLGRLREAAPAPRRPATGMEALRVELRLADDLRSRPPAVWFDAVHGVAFLPADEAPAAADRRAHPGRSVPAEPSVLPGVDDDI